MRPTMSLEPPGGNTMMTRTGLAGYACDHAAPLAAEMTSAHSNTPATRNVLMPFLLVVIGCSTSKTAVSMNIMFHMDKEFNEPAGACVRIESLPLGHPRPDSR